MLQVSFASFITNALNTYGVIETDSEQQHSSFNLKPTPPTIPHRIQLIPKHTGEYL